MPSCKSISPAVIPPSYLPYVYLPVRFSCFHLHVICPAGSPPFCCQQLCPAASLSVQLYPVCLLSSILQPVCLASGPLHVQFVLSSACSSVRLLSIFFSVRPPSTVRLSSRLSSSPFAFQGRLPVHLPSWPLCQSSFQRI